MYQTVKHEYIQKKEKHQTPKSFYHYVVKADKHGSARNLPGSWLEAIAGSGLSWARLGKERLG